MKIERKKGRIWSHQTGAEKEKGVVRKGTSLRGTKVAAMGSRKKDTVTKGKEKKKKEETIDAGLKKKGEDPKRETAQSRSYGGLNKVGGEKPVEKRGGGRGAPFHGKKEKNNGKDSSLKNWKKKNWKLSK